ncbi:MAG: hypothetical protein JXB50_09700 [Spirochaetes bacterium]|nr:hypothetical protein [Spirochaetota bacterium]
MTHNFHFKLEIDSIEILKKIKIFKLKSLSGIIKFIIEYSYKFIEKSHFFDKEENSSYKKIKNNKNVHVYLKKEDYRRLKQIHQDLNYFSIAQILRKIINKFLFYYKKYGLENLIEKINKLSKKISLKLTKNIYRNKQLYHHNYYSITYDKKFSPISYKLLFIT